MLSSAGVRATVRSLLRRTTYQQVLDPVLIYLRSTTPTILGYLVLARLSCLNQSLLTGARQFSAYHVDRISL